MNIHELMLFLVRRGFPQSIDITMYMELHDLTHLQVVRSFDERNKHIKNQRYGVYVFC